MTCWANWNDSNCALWREVRHTLGSTGMKSSFYMLEQWRHAHIAFVSCSSASLPSQLGRWKKPNNDSLKCNFDAAVNREDQQVGCGFIIRNEVLKGGDGCFYGRSLELQINP